ncbi:MAG: dNTP triphosphohydrolase [Gemmatimonadetes bacterium]|nr:dNTP triphosphohydrolase [Gemmatimonadota bacterium]
MESRYSTVISGARLIQSSVPDRDLEVEMLSDKARIITSSAFRRLQTKAQVFSLEKNAAVRTRLTHTLEVAMYGQLIARKVFDSLFKAEQIEDRLRLPFIVAVENACLLHDIGNPPFGHLGEFAIRDWFVKQEQAIKQVWREANISEREINTSYAGFEHFDGNPQGFRTVARLQWLKNESGLNLTCTLLASIVKYLGMTPDDTQIYRKKTGFFRSELGLVKEIWERLGLKVDEYGPAQRHPLTFLMEAADDIAYCVSDIEDALEKGVVNEEEFFHYLPSITQRFVTQPRLDYSTNSVAHNANFIHFRIELTRYLVDSAAECYATHHQAILGGDYQGSLLEHDNTAKDSLAGLKAFAKERIFVSREAVDIELGGFRIIQTLLDGFSPLLLVPPARFERLLEGSTAPLKYGEMALERRLFSLLPKKHLLVYKYYTAQQPADEPIFRSHLVVDYISGMTDSHAVKIFNMLTGMPEGGRR